MKLKKLLAVILALSMVLVCFPSRVIAVEVDVVETMDDSSSQQITCPKCKVLSMAEILDRWWEYGYYYSRYWHTFQCPLCNYIWNTCIIEIEHQYRSQHLDGDGWE